MKLPVLVVALVAACCTVPPSDVTRIEATANVWQLQNTFTNGRASGTPIRIHKGELWLLTARHVPETPAALGWVAIHRDGTKTEEGRVVSLHPEADAAVMAFPLPEDFTPMLITLGYEPLELGRKVYGAGWGGGWQLWLTEGLVSAANRVSSQIVPGDSGGGLFNQEGAQIAILVARGSQFDAHMAFVLPLAEIRDWLTALVE